MTEISDCCLLVFVKYPQKGKVKLRLSAALDENIVQELYRCFVHDTLATAQKINAQLRICFLPADKKDKFQRWLGHHYSFLPQKGSDLGARMKQCFTDALKEGFHRVVLIGSDSPDLPAIILQRAFSELQTHEMVLGPSSDGGYYLIGFQDISFEPTVFDDIDWSTASVFAQTLQKVHDAKKNYILLPRWSDVDTLTDLKHLIKRNENTSFKSSQTITYLQQNKILTEDDDANRGKKKNRNTLA